VSITILDIPRRRAWLECGLGAKARALFGRDQSRPLPDVEFVTPAEARRNGLPETSWYDFDRERIGIYLDPLPDPAREWERLEHHVLHEMLHWTWNFSLELAGARDQIDRTLVNIFADAANEQRAGLANPWARAIVARGRRLLIGDLGSTQHPDEPLWAAAMLTLRAHTCLAARGWTILDATCGSDSEATADAVWARLAPEIDVPAAVAGNWGRAFAIAWRSWRTANLFDLFEAVTEFRALFGDPQVAAPPDSVFALDAHTVAGSPQTKPAQSPQPSAPQEGEGGESQEAGAQDGQDGESQEAGAQSCPEIPCLDDPWAAGDGTGQVGAELAAFGQPAGIWPPLAGTDDSFRWESVTAASGRELLADARTRGVELGRRIKSSLAPRTRIRSERGRAVARIVAREPDAARPFKTRTSTHLTLTPDTFIGVVVDTSGSMTTRGKIGAARVAAMAVAVACDTAQTPYAIVTSRGALHVGGDGLSLDRTAALLAGLTAEGGDGLEYSLAPVLTAVGSRPEPVRIVIVVQDGEPCSPAPIRAAVERHRKAGTIVVAAGVGLTPHEAKGLRDVFGEQACLTTPERLARDLGDEVSAAVVRSRRRRDG